MKKVTATQAARNFRALLDEVEMSREEFVIHRRGRPVARLVPTGGKTKAQDLIDFLKENPPDPDWAEDQKKIREWFNYGGREWTD